MKITVLGTGYVGLVTGSCLASLGHDVLCIDIDPAKIEGLKNGVCPIYEPGLEDIIKLSRLNDNLKFSTKLSDSGQDTEVYFICVGTPSGDDGSADLRALRAASADIANHVEKKAIAVIKSTVPIGTNKEIEDFFNGQGKENIEVVSNPEFLREGQAVNDFLKPERIVIGANTEYASLTMQRVYEPLVRNGNPIFIMDRESAELSKYAANLFLAVKISYINEIAKLCEAVDADVKNVRKVITSDSRIGKQFLYPGPGFGGSCFPKDLRSIIHMARKLDSNMLIAESAYEINEKHRKWIGQTIAKRLTENSKVCIWGAAFKANTDDIRESIVHDVIADLEAAGCEIVIHDPVALDNMQEEYGERLSYASNHNSALEGCDALIILTEWTLYRTFDAEKAAKIMKGRKVFDARNILARYNLNKHDFEYWNVGNYGIKEAL